MTTIPTVRVATVTRAQRAVLVELARDGASNEEIARRLGLSFWTVKSHLQSAQKAMGCTNRTQMAVALLRGHIKLHTVRVRNQEAAA